MKSPLQKSETGMIKSKKGHAEPQMKGPEDHKALGGGASEMQSMHKPFPPTGHNMPSFVADPTLPGNPIIKSAKE